MDEKTAGTGGPAGDVDPQPDRYAARFVWGVWALLLALLFTYLSVFAYDIPFLDEYELVDALTGHQKIDFAWLWSQHNEHRIFLPRLLHLGLAWLTNSDFRAGMYFNALALAGMAAAMILVARRLRGQTSYFDAFFPLALLNYGHCENLLWSFQIEFVLSTIFAVGLLLVVTLQGHRGPSLLSLSMAAACLLALPLTGAHGLPFVPPFAVWLIVWAWPCRLMPGGGRTVALATLSAAASLFLVAWYFVGYTHCELHPPSPGLETTFKVTRQFLAMGCGAGIIAYWRLARFLGVCVLVISAAVLVWKWWRAPHERVRSFGLLAFLVGLTGLALAIGWGRGGIGPHLGFSFRYVTLSVPGVCCLYFMAQVFGPKAGARIVQATLFLVFAGLLKENTRHGYIYAQTQQGHFEAVLADLRAHRTPQEIARKHPFLYPVPDLLAERLEKLRDAGIGPWVLMGPDQSRFAATRPTHEPPG
jgi:hypothetical protein